MSALRKAKVASGFLLLSLSLASGTAYSQQGESRGSGEIPDLQGVYSIATVTMLERGEQFGGELVISAEQAAAVGETGASYLDDLVSNVGGAEAQVGGYNTFWMDPGERMAVIDGGIRTSIIVEPEDGRLPWAEGAQRRIFGSMRAQGAFDGPEVRPMGERCLVGFGSSGGPPMLPVLYNNHSQIVQTDDYVMILAEMNHDARIIRLKDSQHGEMHKWLGDSIGYYDGDSLVVETTNFHAQEGFGAPFVIFSICLRMPESLKDFPALMKTRCSIDSRSMIRRFIPDPGAVNCR